MRPPVFLIEWHRLKPAVAATTTHTLVVRLSHNLLGLKTGVNVGLWKAKDEDPSPRSTRYCLLSHRRST